MQALFDLVRGPVATTAAATRWRGLLVVAVDGTLVPVPDAPATLGVFSKQRCNSGAEGFPQIRLTALVACGTRAVVGAAFGSASTGELEYTGCLTGDLRPGVLLLGDRNFGVADLLNRFAATGGHLLVRCKSSRRLVPVARLRAQTLPCRARRAGRPGHRRRDQHRHLPRHLYRPLPAAGHSHRPIDVPSLRTHPAPPRTPGDRGGVSRAEIHDPGGGSCAPAPRAGSNRRSGRYRPLRTAMADATDGAPGTDPDRADFTVALSAARDQVVLAAGCHLQHCHEPGRSPRP